MNLEQAVILAAGKGTRLGKTGEKKQKCSIPLKYNLPIIDKFFKEVIIVVGHRAEDVEKETRRIKKRNKLKLKIDYVEQEEQKGQGHAVYLVKDKIHEGLDFCVINGDLIVEKMFFEKILKEDVETPLITISYVDDPWKYGVLSFDKNERIKSIVEKPDKGKGPSNWIVSGIYFFNKGIFDYIKRTEPNKEKKNEIFLADTMHLMIGEGKNINYFKINYPTHISTKEDLEFIEDTRIKK